MSVDRAAFEGAAPVRMAVCNLTSSDTVKGTLTFVENANGVVKVSGTIKGLAAGDHGFHIHEFGDYTAGCASTGSHFNPTGKDHGNPKDVNNRHIGDLGNITSTGGDTQVEMYDDQIKLDGPHNIIGRGLVVHADPDDLGKGGHPDSLTTGHAGARLACGIVGLAKLQ